jgi:superoxide dismutase, Fe-Mn family
VTDAGTRHCSQSVRAQFDFVLGGVVMRYHLKQIYCRPWTLSGFSLKLIESHYENNYGGALRRLNAITEQLESLDFAKAPGYVINGLKREELAALNSTLLHELYFASMGGDGRVTKGMSEALVRDFGSVQRWRTEFSAMGYALSGGSGWVLLTWLPRDGRLINQYAADHSQAVASGIPLLALDMYEHAYHIDFGANATAYVDTFLRNADWQAVEGRYEDASKVAPPRPLVQDEFRDVPGVGVEEVRAMLAEGNRCNSSTRARSTSSLASRTSRRALPGATPSASASGWANSPRKNPWWFIVPTVFMSAAAPRSRCATRVSTPAT